MKSLAPNAVRSLCKANNIHNKEETSQNGAAYFTQRPLCAQTSVPTMPKMSAI